MMEETRSFERESNLNTKIEHYKNLHEELRTKYNKLCCQNACLQDKLDTLEAKSETTTSQKGQAELQEELDDLQTELDLARETFADSQRAHKLELDDLNQQLRKKHLVSYSSTRDNDRKSRLPDPNILEDIDGKLNDYEN